MHDEVEFVGSLEGIGESDEEGVVDVLQDHLLSLGVLNLVLFDDIILVNTLHREQFLRVLLLNQQHRSKGTLTKHDLGHEIIDGHFFLQIIPGVKCPGGFAHHFLLFLLALEIDLEAHIIMHDKLALDILDALLLLLLLRGGVVDQVQLLPIIDGQFLACSRAVGLQDEVDDLITPISRRISAWGEGIPVIVLLGDVDDELSSDLADSDGLDLLGIDLSLDG